MRPLPAFASLLPPVSVTIELERCLQNPISHSTAQVWLARVIPPGSIRTAESERVVVNILQPSMMHATADQTWTGAGRTSAESFALTEEYIYHQLKPIQGSAVPYFFGLHNLRTCLLLTPVVADTNPHSQVTTPSGERAYMLVTEYIEGTNLAEWTELHTHMDIEGNSTLNASEQQTQWLIMQKRVEIALRSLKAIHDLGVVYCRMGPSNLILHPSSEWTNGIVIIDFTLCRREDHKFYEECVATDREEIILAFQCCNQHYATLLNWTEDNMP
ncbi:hypothetical protein BV25DRAFT_742993 [Artomyces pyxidatus]|uniref:Uncharacterized protein n=1 Tax=Artomyces pyxidatus TaxID=48021 RepID=A0ACB8T134_9AGAM|nr:hypothetical protein BV25DRAFT_742993 [Artomyces pyxidatus]